MSKKHLTISNRIFSRPIFLRLALSLFLIMFVCTVAAVAQSTDRAKLLEEIIALQAKIKNTTDPAELAALRNQLKSKEKLFLAPAPEDFAVFADWLKQPGTGLMRLLPRESFEEVLSIEGGGAYFSFINQDHDYDSGVDLELQGERLSVGFYGSNFGFLVSLKDTPLESVKLDTPGVNWLASFTPPLDKVRAQEQARRAREGVQNDGFVYISSYPVSEATTYALRAVNYTEDDVLVVFRVHRQDTDGSLIIAWKLLKRYPTPQLNGETIVTTSAASYAQSNYAPNTIAVAFAKDLTGGDYFATEPTLPIELGGVHVSVQDSSDRKFQLYAPLFAVTPKQVNFLLPPEVAEGYAYITVFTSLEKRLREIVRIAKTAPGLFTANADGQGVPTAVALRIRNGVQTYEPVARFDGAQNKFVPAPIDLGGESDRVILLLFGTGISGRTALDKVSVKIGGIEAQVLYAGAQGMPGFDQVNVALPRSLAGLGEVDVILTVDGHSANKVQVKIN